MGRACPKAGQRQCDKLDYNKCVSERRHERQVQNKVQVFAVVRVDLDAASAENAFTVKEVLPTEDEAAAEVERLNALNAVKGTRYFWQATRYFPKGRTLKTGGE